MFENVTISTEWTLPIINYYPLYAVIYANYKAMRNTRVRREFYFTEQKGRRTVLNESIFIVNMNSSMNSILKGHFGDHRWLPGNLRLPRPHQLDGQGDGVVDFGRCERRRKR